jgi:tetratricopeptide (TPR) repeat protein
VSIRLSVWSFVWLASIGASTAISQAPSAPGSRIQATNPLPANSAQVNTSSESADADEAEARKTAERFLLVLERNPRKGTALDKVVQFHVDHESLGQLVERLREKAEASVAEKPEDAGRAWLVVGLIEALQGDAEGAQPAFEQAEKLLPKSAVASFSLGQNLVTLNRWSDAAAALERAVQRQPAPTDLLEVFQTLGRVQQRLAGGEQVVEVWTRLEKLVPNDPRVPELIAKTLLDDGHWEAALPRFEALAKQTKDLYRRSEFELEAVDLRLKLGQFERALAEADRLLGGLKPDHWLFRETRRRVEEAFLAKDDAKGLIQHYEERLAQQSDDFDAIVRLARTLISQERTQDARTHLEAGIKLAPSSVELRLELIELLKSEQQFFDAIAQYEQLDRIEPNHPDHVREWGFAVLRGQPSEVGNQDGEHKEQVTRAKAAAAIWLRLVEAKPQDAVVAAQVADLMASADVSLRGDAAELYRKAIALEPNSAAHRERLGEVLDAAGKKDESLAAWRSIAEESRRTADNLASLADVLSRFGYRDEALTTIDAACELDRKSLELRFQQAELRRQWKQAESAMTALAEAAALADTPETFDRIVQLEVKVLTESELLTERIEALQAKLVTNSEGGGRKAEQDTVENSAFGVPHSALLHFRLAKYLEAADKLREATVAARKAVELAPKNGVFLQAAAKMLTQESQWLSAVEMYERLLKLDRRFRIDSLRSIAELEQKLGRKDKALKASRDLLAAAPGNPEVAEFVVDAHLRFNQSAEALQILRRASRQNATDKRLALKLVERLMDEGGRGRGEGGTKTSAVPPSVLRIPNSLEEAREVLWRVFEQSAKTDDRIEVIGKLAEFSVFPGEFAKLTQRLERYRAEPKLRRDASLALVQVHEQSGDTEQARRELERLLPQAPRDGDLLKRMVSLCESSGDLDGAIAHQKRFADLTRKREADEHLIVLLRRAGRDADADLLAMRWLETERDPAKLLREIDRMLGDAAPAKTQSLHQTLKLIHAGLDREPQHWEFLLRQAMTLFALNRIPESWASYDELMGLPIPDDTLSLLAPPRASGASLADRMAQRVQQVRARINIETQPAPTDYGRARVLVLLHRMAHKIEPTIPAPVGLDAKATAVRTAWDAVYLNLVRSGGSERLRTRMELLSQAPDDPAAQWLALTALYGFRTEQSFWPLASWKEIDRNNPLDVDTLDALVAAFRGLQGCDEAMEWDRTPAGEVLCRELIRAGRTETAQELLAELERTSASPEAFGWLLQQAAVNDDHDGALRILAKFTSLDLSRAKFASSARGTRRSDPANVAWWLSRAMIERRRSPDDPAAFGPHTLRILDAAFAAFATGNLPNPAAKPTVSTQTVSYSISQNRNQPRYTLASTPFELGLVWKSPEQFAVVKEDFPSEDSLPGVSAMHVLRQAWSLAETPEDRGILLAHVQASLKTAESESRAFFLWKTALACLQWWDRQSSEATEQRTREALATMRELFDLPPASATLKLSIVANHLKQEEHEQALDLLDRIETTDRQLVKEIEQRAVHLAGKLQRRDRVQLAAERLFGMKLEPAEELQLAATLSGLGLHEHAEAIRLRLPQRAGNNLTLLQQMMQERIEAKQIDEACQIAEQIMRRTAPANPLIGSVPQSTFGGGQQARVITQTSQARTKALALLGQQGRLGPLIEQAEQQFDRSPQSLKLFGQLAELYAAAGTPEKQTGLLVRLADSDAPDPQFRLTLARALVSAGKAELAVPHFLFAIERLPNATAQVLFEAEAILSELGHTEELARIVLKSKLAVNDQQRIELFSRIVSRLEGPPIRAKLIIDLFEKAFREAPNFRLELTLRLLTVSESVWQQEDMWPIARELVIPPQDAKEVQLVFHNVYRLHSGKQIDSLFQRTVESAAQWQRLDELSESAESALRQHPSWNVFGNTLLGFVRLRQGRNADASRHFQIVLQPLKESSKKPSAFNDFPQPPNLTASAIGLALARSGEHNLAAEFFECSPDPALVLEHCRWFGNQPEMQQLAVRIVHRMLARLDDNDNLTLLAGSPLFVEAAKVTAEINQPFVAARLAQAMITRWQLPGANNSDGGTWLEQLEQRFTNSRAAIKPAMLPEIISSSPLTSNPSPQRGEGDRAGIDLLPHVTGDSLANLRLDSPFVSLIRDAAKDKELWVRWTESLRRTGTLARPSDAAISDKPANSGTGKSARPADLSLAILEALTELFTRDSNGDRTALQNLVAVAKSHSKSARPRTAPPGFHPQLGLWLVARECLARDELKPLGEQLAELATESAAQHFDPRFQWAILRERGELARRAGNVELARKLWTQMAEDVLRPRSSDEAVPMLLGKEFVWSANWPNTRLNRARDLCRMTLNGEMPDLSLAIFRDAVNWPKTAPFVARSAEAEVRGNLVIDANSMTWLGPAEDVLAAWDTLEPEWRAKGVAADAIFATLLECVLPSNRPDEVFVFPVAHASRVRHGESLARRLVDLAVAEQRTDTLKQRLAEREKAATKSLALRLMHLLLARRTNDEPRLEAELTKLARHDWSKPSFEDGRVATQIVGLLAPMGERREPIGKVFEQWVGPLGKAFPRDEHPLGDVRRWLAKQQLDHQPDKAKETIASHLRHMDQVWSGTGAMDGQHLRRLELLAIATDYANAGLTREAIDLLAQVADARWPDRYPDENPGAVLAILEGKLQSRPAQERYELWRAWSLPNDGVKSLRMLSGAAGSGQKSEVGELKSTAFLLVEVAREADRLAELDAFVEEQMKARPSDRIHVLLALIHFANQAPAVAETLVRQQITVWEPQAGKNPSATRTRVWDDWLLSAACARHESLRELAEQLGKRAESGARELKDAALLSLMGQRKQ